jgi:hypothetical protein
MTTPEVLAGLSSQWPALLFVAVWCIWWLCAVNWRKMWPVLAEGAWAPAVLLLAMSAMAWSFLDPRDCPCLGSRIPNGWWQLIDVCCLAALALFCGWLQGYYGWTPQEISVEPPPVSHDHGHGHAAAHH